MKDLTARDIMSCDVMTVNEETTVRELAELLVREEISGTPVVAADGGVLGVVSFTDLGLLASGSGAVAPDRSNPGFYLRGWEDRLNPDELRQLHIEDEGLLVRDVMNPAVYSVPSPTSVPEIAKTMAEGHLHRLLVIDDGKVVGIVSSLDVLKVVAAL